MSISRMVLGLLAVQLAACRDATPTEPEPLTVPEFRARAVAAKRSAVEERFATVDIHNPNPSPGSITLRNPCGVLVVLYRDQARSTPAAWQEYHALHGCKSFEHTYVVPPHGFVSVSSIPFETRAILGDSLPDGEYWGAAVVSVTAPLSQAVVLPLGPLRLSR